MNDVHFKGPNVLITGIWVFILETFWFFFVLFKYQLKGTPGTGKTTLAKEVAQCTKLNYISITDLAKENNFFLNYDAELECHELDEDKVIDEIDELMKEGIF